MYHSESASTDKRLKIVYRQADYDAFVAAFVYYYFSGEMSPLIAAIPPAICGGLNHVPPQRAKQNVSFGTHLQYVSTPGDKVMFVSFENMPTFDELVSPEVRQWENENSDELARRYIYDSSKSLTQLVLESLHAEAGLDPKSNAFIKLNQFFSFYPSGGDEFQVNPEVQNNILTWFPDLNPQDFVRLKDLVADAFSGMKFRRSAEERDRAALAALKYVENDQAIPSNYLKRKGLSTEACWCFNANVDHPRAADVFGRTHASSIIFKVIALYGKSGPEMKFNDTAEVAVRVRVLSRKEGVALTAFSDISGAKVVGNQFDAEWLLPTTIIPELVHID